MALVNVNSPYSYYANPSIGRPIFNGQIFIGVVDTDPTIEANQIPVFALQENGSTIPIPQPIATNSGGLTVDANGSLIIIQVDESNSKYSMTVLDRSGSQEYQVPNVGATASGGGSGGSFKFFCPSDFGATETSDSVAEVQSCFTAAASVGGTVYIDKVYRVDESINGLGVSIVSSPEGALDFSNAETLSISRSCLYYAGTLTNLGQPSLDIEKGKASITLTTAPTDIAAGDVLLIGSTEQFTSAREAYKKGEAPIVNVVNGDQIDVFGSLFDSYTAANTTIFKLTPTSPSINCKIIASPIRGCRGLWVKNGQGVEIRVNTVGAGTNGIMLQQCFDTNVDKTYTVEVAGNSGSYTGTEYGLVAANCQRLSISGSTMIGERHGFSTGGFSNDFENDTVAIVCREIAVSNCFISQDLIANDHDLGSSIAGFDLHGNSEFCTVDNNVIHNGAVYAGNNNSFTNNHVYGSNDNGGQLFRCIEMVGADHLIDGNTFVSTVGRVSISKDVPFSFLLFTHTDTPGLSSNNALMFGGTFKFTNNKCYNVDDSTTANTKPHEYQWRIDDSFTGGDIHIVFEGNSTRMPRNRNLYSIGLRTLALSSFTTTPINPVSLTERNNEWYECGALNTLSEDDETQFALDKVYCVGSKVFANDQAQYAYFLRNIKEYAEIKDSNIDGVTASPIYITNGSLTAKNSTTAVQTGLVQGNTVTNSIKAGVGSTTQNMGLMIGVKDLILKDNKNITSPATNMINLFYIDSWAGVSNQVYLDGNIDTGGVETYQYGPNYLSTVDHFQEIPQGNLKRPVETSTFLMKYNQKNPYKVNTTLGAFNVSFGSNGLTQNARFSIMDVGGALDVNPITLTMSGYTFVGQASLDLDVVRKTYEFQLDETNLNWEVTNA